MVWLQRRRLQSDIFKFSLQKYLPGWNYQPHELVGVSGQTVRTKRVY